MTLGSPRLLIRLGAASVLCCGHDVHAHTADRVAELAPAYHQQQFDRLVRAGDRDSLIAAVLVGMSADPKRKNASGFDDAVDRMVEAHPRDLTAIYAAALACHVQLEACTRPELRTRLLALDPRNAVHYLLVPNAGALGKTDLTKASSCPTADTHFSRLLGIVRHALRGQPAPASEPSEAADGGGLALSLRQNAVLQVPWPRYGAVSAVCTPALAAGRADAGIRQACADLGRLLLADAGDNIATRMVGSSTVRRFLPGTPAADAAKAMRAQYVWLSERQASPESITELELLQEEEVRYGEWEAFKRQASRAGIPRLPPANWIPARPKLLLLPEEAAASP